LNPTIPLGFECYIRLIFPNDLDYEFNFVAASGMFLPRSLSDNLSTDDIVIIKPTTQEPR